MQDISPQELENLRSQIIDTRSELEQVSSQLTAKQTDLRQVENDLSDLNAKYLQAREDYEDLRSETAIISAQQKGLAREVDRLNELVGGLEQANERRLATKNALSFAVDRLFVQVRESCPLTPPKYDLQERLASVDRLREKLEQSNYVTPELQQQYTDLFLDEIERSTDQEYFFARLIVTDRFGAKHAKWAECLMKGNWSVYYRTLDGKNIGMYTNIGDAQTPHWGYLEELPDSVKRQIEDEVIATRVEDYDKKVAVLAEKQLAMDDRSALQRNFDAL